MRPLAEALSVDDSGYAAIEGTAALLEFRESRRGSAPSARQSITLGQLTARPTRSRQCQAPADPAAAKTETKSNGSRQRNGVVLADSRNHRGRANHEQPRHQARTSRRPDQAVTPSPARQPRARSTDCRGHAPRLSVVGARPMPLRGSSPKPAMRDSLGRRRGKRPARRDSVAKAVCGFANAIGGYLIIGAEREGAGWRLRGVSFPSDEPGTWISSCNAVAALRRQSVSPRTTRSRGGCQDRADEQPAVHDDVRRRLSASVRADAAGNGPAGPFRPVRTRRHDSDAHRGERASGSPTRLS